MVEYNLGYEQRSGQMRGGRGLGHGRGGIQAGRDTEVKKKEDKCRDREEDCESGAKKCLQVFHLLEEEPKYSIGRKPPVITTLGLLFRDIKILFFHFHNI